MIQAAQQTLSGELLSADFASVAFHRSIFHHMHYATVLYYTDHFVACERREFSAVPVMLGVID